MPLRPGPAHRRPTLPLLALMAGGIAGAQLMPAATWLPGVRRWFPSLAGLGRVDHVALTFDDGPDPRSTPAFLDVLDEFGIRATFFIIGERAARHPRILQRMVDAGHELAVHGWRHDYAFLRPLGLRRTVNLLAEIGGARPRWFRPPYGVLTTSAFAEAVGVGLQPVLWSAWGRDWTQAATPASVLRTLAPDLRGGATVLLHDAVTSRAADSWRAALGAIPSIVEACAAEGLELGPLADHGVPDGPFRRVDRDGGR